jgi:hypothetical protein
MFLRFSCPSGHKLKANLCLEGRKMACPVCEQTVVVPERQRAPLTETGAFRLLSACEAESPLASPRRTAKTQAHSTLSPSKRFSAGKTCPRCETELREGVNICTTCQLHVGVSLKEWASVLRSARQSAAANR